MFRKQSQVRHISWEELDEMIRSLAGVINRTKYNAVCAADPSQDSIPAAMLAVNTGLPLQANGDLVFSVYSDFQVKACLFKKNYSSEHYNNENVKYLEDLEVDEEGKFQTITFPWQKG